ncbi:MAG: hypothetical protein JNG83_14350 [Opitutaceae bacterium]|nr:hypothetical protein [Opitutaceae bacterium]
MKILPQAGRIILVSALAFACSGYSQEYLNSLPATQNVVEGRNLVFGADGAPGAIQWQISLDGGYSFVNLKDDASYAGTHTPTLELIGVTPALARAQIRFTSTNNGIVLTSRSTVLSVSPSLLPNPTGIAIDEAGTLYISDATNHTVHRAILVPDKISLPVVPRHLEISTLAGRSGQTGTSDGAGTTASFNQPTGLAVDLAGGLVVSNTANGMIRSISSAGQVSTLAGSSAARGNLDGAGATARFSTPMGVARGPDGAFYLADAANHTIRKVTATGIVSTFAGSPGQAGSSDGLGQSARFNNPTGLTIDRNGLIYVADTTNNLIRKITPAGIVTTVAGMPGIAGTNDGAVTSATFNAPSGLGISRNADFLFVADTGNSTIRMIQLSRGVVRTFAGLPAVGGLKDGTDGLFNQPKAIAVSADDDFYMIRVYVADTGNATIREATFLDGVVTLPLSLETTSTPPVTPPSTPSNSGSSGTPTSSASGGGALDVWLVLGLGGLAIARRLGSPIIRAI